MKRSLLCTALLASATFIGFPGPVSSKDPGWTREAHTAAVSVVAFSADGETLASGGEDNRIKLWRVSNGHQMQELEGHSQAVSSLAFSPDGSVLASGSFDRSIKLWRVAERDKSETLGMHPTAQVKGLSFSPDGRLLASTGNDGIRIWKMDSRELLRFIPTKQGVLSAVFSPNGMLLASAGGTGVNLWDLHTFKLRRSLGGGSKGISMSLAFSPDGGRLAGGGSDRIIRVWDVATGRLDQELDSRQDAVRSLAFENADEVVLCADRKAVRAWHVASKETAWEISYSDSPVSVSLSADGRFAARGLPSGRLKLASLPR